MISFGKEKERACYDQALAEIARRLGVFAYTILFWCNVVELQGSS
jgi:hypothetical protein